jgi:hypothetical protein
MTVGAAKLLRHLTSSPAPNAGRAPACSLVPAARTLHARPCMNATSASSSELLDSDRPAEPHCAQCGDRLERGRTRVRSTSTRRICVDCAFDDVPQDE